LTQLKWLDMSFNPIDDSGTKYLSGLVNLIELHLDATEITDRSFANFKEMRRLETLSLMAGVHKTGKIKPEGLRELAALPSLVHLNLDYCALDDDAIGPLAELTQLGLLSLDGNHFSEVGLKRLRSLMPNTRVLAGRQH